jgi:hypothetical protein
MLLFSFGFPAHAKRTGWQKVKMADEDKVHMQSWVGENKYVYVKLIV